MKKMLIIGTVPYSTQNQSRAMISYLGRLLEDYQIFQIFSNPDNPQKTFYEGLFQITDEMVLYSRLHNHRNISLGATFSKTDISLQASPFIDQPSPSSGKKEKYHQLKKLKNFKYPFIKLLRGILWDKKFWKRNEKMLAWVNQIKPDLIYCCFSDDFFILNMAIYFAEKYNVPVISQISDDYYFNGHFSLSPFYFAYRAIYKKKVKKLLSLKGGAFFICEEAKKRYDYLFNIPSQVFYISSTFEPSPDRFQVGKKIIYAGNLELGRYEALIDAANALQRIDKSLFIDCYAPILSKRILKKISLCKGIHYHGSVPYEKIREELSRGNVLIILENTHKKYIRKTRYSLSTKVADALSLGIPILAYGSLESGAINYLNSNETACCCFAKSDLEDSFRKILFDQSFRGILSERAIDLSIRNHRQEKTAQKFYEFVESIMGD